MIANSKPSLGDKIFIMKYIFLLWLILLLEGYKALAQSGSEVINVPKGIISATQLIYSIEKATGMAIHYEAGILDMNRHFNFNGSKANYEFLLRMLVGDNDVEFIQSDGTIWIRRKHRKRDVVVNRM